MGENTADGNGSGAAYNRIIEEIAIGGYRRIVMFGHSHGGGSVYNLATRLASNNSELPHNQDGFPNFSVMLTGYVDAVANSWSGDDDPLALLPPESGRHVNLYQNPEDWWLHGVPVAGSRPDIDVNGLQCVDGVGHSPVASCPVVHYILEEALRSVSFGCEEDTDYCGQGLACIEGAEDD